MLFCVCQQSFVTYRVPKHIQYYVPVHTEHVLSELLHMQLYCTAMQLLAS